MLLLSPYYFSIEEASRLSGCSFGYIESLYKKKIIRTKKVLVLLNKNERGLKTFINLEDLFDYALKGEPVEKRRDEIIAKRRKKIKKSILIASLSFLIFSFSIILARPIDRILSAFTPKEETVSFYAKNCEGGWINPQNTIGAPSVLSNGSLEKFSYYNSAIYLGGAEKIVCEGFLTQEELEKRELKEKEIIKTTVNFSFALLSTVSSSFLSASTCLIS